MLPSRHQSIHKRTQKLGHHEMSKGVAVKSKAAGKGCIRPTKPILPEDILKIGNYFHHDVMNALHPKKVQRCVLFYILYFFCHHWKGKPLWYGNRLVQSLRWSWWYQIFYTSEKVKDEMDKNHRSNETSETNQARMYENPGKLFSFKAMQ